LRTRHCPAFKAKSAGGARSVLLDLPADAHHGTAIPTALDHNAAIRKGVLSYNDGAARAPMAAPDTAAVSATTVVANLLPMAVARIDGGVEPVLS